MWNLLKDEMIKEVGKLFITKISKRSFEWPLKLTTQITSKIADKKNLSGLIKMSVKKISREKKFPYKKCP